MNLHENTATAVLTRQGVARPLFVSKLHIEHALAGSGLALWEWDLESDTVQLTSQWQVMLGGASEPTVTTFSALAELVHADDVAAMREHLTQVLKGLAPRYQADVRVRTPAGGWIWVHTVGSVVKRDRSGRALEMMGSNLNITERKRSEQTLRANEERFRSAFNQAGVGFHITSLAGDYLQVNEQYCGITGYGEAELLGLSVQDTQSPQDREESRGFRRAMLSGGPSVVHRERQVVRKDGATLLTSIWFSLVRDEAGKPLYFMSVVQDISARKKTDTQLRESREQFEQLANNIPEIFWITDAARQKSIFISPACAQVLGYDAQTLSANPRLLIKAIHPDDRRAVFEARRRIGEDVYDQTYRIVRPDQSIRWVQDRAFPVRDELGRVYRYAGIAEDITEWKAAEERLERLAHYDVLSGLPNRALFHDRLSQAIAHAGRHHWLLSVMFIDMDNFKKINDTLGHDCGDKLLQQVAGRLYRAVRAEDTVGRLGGDEFAVVLNALDHGEDANRVAQKIMAAFDEPFQIDQTELHVTVSIGITVYPDDGVDPGTLLKHADVAMYSAKAAGRNAFKFYSADMNAKAFDQLSVENSLRRALARNEFELHYQPKASVVTGALTGLEALLRWRHADRGMVSPVEFIPMLEDTGLILQVGEWVLEAVCSQLNEWASVGITGVCVAINLSARQFASKDLAQRFEAILDFYQVDPRCIELEITESALMTDPEAARRMLDYLKALGVRLAIDDFGTGYSSLAYLKRFPIDTLKIDASFVRDVTTDADDAIIARTVIAMAHNMRLTVVAEGVETAEQLAFLAEHGCDQYQGYYLSRPRPAPAWAGQFAGSAKLQQAPLLAE
jgi:diguanylate cyclase (GGDEF)-like protein/PAS domain S-box-containing protein